MANDKRGNPIFAVRLTADLQDEIRAAAKREGVGVAAWVANAVRGALGGAQSGLQAKAGPDYQTQLDALTDRVAALETAFGERRSSTTRPKPVPRPAGEGDGMQPVARGAARSRLSDEKIALIRALSAEGLSQREVARRADVDRTMVRKYGSQTQKG